MDNQRSVTETLTLYEFEPTLKDIYVEGKSDQRVLNRFLSKYKIRDVTVRTADFIDFTELYGEMPDIKRNNKAKLLALNEILLQKFGESLEGITIALDRDFCEIRDNLNDCLYVLYYDYNSLELYLFNENVLDIFIQQMLDTFPYSGSQILNSIKPVLIEKFLIRVVVDKHGNFKKSAITDLSKSIIIDKRSGLIEFDPKRHLQKILNNIKKTKEEEIFLKDIEDFREKLSKEDKNNIRGHDFIHLLVCYLKKIKSKLTADEKTLERSLFQCIDYSEIRKEAFFVSLEGKYSE